MAVTSEKTSKPPLSFEQLMSRSDAPPGSTWGLFGKSDEVGMINLLTPERVLSGINSVRRGVMFNLDIDLGAFDPPISYRQPPKHTMLQKIPHHWDDYLDGFWLQGVSQIDGLRHYEHSDYGYYNSQDPSLIKVGSPVLGINRWAEHGIAGRGVLLDVAGYLESIGQPIDYAVRVAFGTDLLDATAAAQGVLIEAGDMVLIRTGWLEHVRRSTAEQRAAAIADRDNLVTPGIEQDEDVLRWIWEHQIPLLAADNLGVEALPTSRTSPFRTSAEAALPGRAWNAGMFHNVLIPLLGIALGELWFLDALAEDCAAHGSWDFLLTAKPLNLTGGVGSPANATAIR
jgi:kynurenine formamidase